MDAIRVDSLTKKFNGLTAVDKVSFRIQTGEIFGLLGPNGAGKTTIISMLATLLNPTSGVAFVNGFNILREKAEVRKSIGIVFQDQSLDEELTAYENMVFHGRLYRIPKEIRRTKSLELLKLVELEDRKNDLVKTFSGGMRRRLEIARGLLHEPKILFLDEPTLGLDPQTRNHLWEYIQRLNQEKHVTIILTTHYMEEADKLCNTLAIIDRGQIVILDTPKKLKDAIGGDMLVIESDETASLQTEIKGFKWAKDAKLHDGNLIVNLIEAEKHIAELVSMSYTKSIPIDSISIHKPTLQDVFLHYTGRTIRDEEVSGKEHMRMMRNRRRR